MNESHMVTGPSNCVRPRNAQSSEVEGRHLVDAVNNTAVEFPHDKLIHEIFSENVARAPGATAVASSSTSLSYSELDRAANQLAHYLRKQGLAIGEYVPIVLQRGISMIIAQVAVLRCGAAYVPIDPAAPYERQQFIIRDCRARFPVTEDTLDSAGLTDLSDVKHLRVIDAPMPEWTPDTSFQLSPKSASHVMYTSGSTGVPKGVIVPHRGVSRLAVNNGYAEIRPTDCIAHCANPAFDASTFEIWAALLNGASIFIVPAKTVTDSDLLAETLAKHGVTILFLTTALFNQHAASSPKLFSQFRYVLFGGESADPGAVRQVLRIGAPTYLLNVYGPTEATAFATTYRISSIADDATYIPIGKPISNTKIHILDSKRQPVPIGVAGEIYVGGPGVACGYLNRPELTIERFVPDCFSPNSREHLYRTGDLGSWQADGNITFLGRNDYQIKIRGFRVEPGEVEAALQEHAAVKQALVILREDTPGEKRLVAYVITTECHSKVAESTHAPTETIRQLREFLSARLPAYLIPAAIVVIDEFPLTSNGKIDRSKLPAPGDRSQLEQEYVAARSETEKILTCIWSNVLGLDIVGIDDNFLELGGHSISGIKLALQVSDKFSIQMRSHAVFEYPTIREMAQLVGFTLMLVESACSTWPDTTTFEEGVI